MMSVAAVAGCTYSSDLRRHVSINVSTGAVHTHLISPEISNDVCDVVIVVVHEELHSSSSSSSSNVATTAVLHHAF
jgi:hypothetical protein